MISDGFHSLTDSASNIVGLAGAKASRKPPDEDHPYGHRKFETLAAAGIFVFLLLAVVEVARSALSRLSGGIPPEVTRWSFAVMLGTIAVNLVVVSYERGEARRLDSELLRADATHTLPDVPILRALRVGEQPGADRIVFEFDGDGLPAWSISYVDRPVYECGSGHVVRLPGDAWLQVRFMGAQAHTAQGESTTGPKLRAFGMTNLVALARVCDFEGEVTWVAAVKRPAGYTPRVLDAPARLAVDLAH